MGRMTLITGGERRRRWSEDDRARILAEIEEPGAVVAEVARREDVCTSLVYKWRREARKSADATAPGFAPVVIEALPRAPLSAPASEPEPSVIVVEVKRRARADRRWSAVGADRGDLEGAAFVIPIPRAACGSGSRRATRICDAACRGWRFRFRNN